MNALHELIQLRAEKWATDEVAKAHADVLTAEYYAVLKGG